MVTTTANVHLSDSNTLIEAVDLSDRSGHLGVALRLRESVGGSGVTIFMQPLHIQQIIDALAGVKKALEARSPAEAAA